MGHEQLLFIHFWYLLLVLIR